jgi:hypothetical protein
LGRRRWGMGRLLDFIDSNGCDFRLLFLLFLLFSFLDS